MATSLAERVGQAHLVYLSLLPAVGTFLILGVFHIPINAFLFLIVGTAAIGIYIAVLASYTPIGHSLWKNVLRLIDGPLWVLAGLLFGGTVTNALTEGVLLEITSVLLGVFLVVLTSKIPSRDQRIQSFFAVGIPLLGTLILFLLYGMQHLINPVKIALIVAAIAQSTFTHYRTVDMDDVVRDSSGYILVGIIPWIGALIAGSVLLDISRGN